MWKRFVTQMEEQLPPSIPAPDMFAQVPPSMPTISPEMVEQMKLRARQEAIRITMEQRQTPMQVPPSFPTQPQVVYVRRSLTLAELLVTLAIACGIVLGVQAGWNFATKVLPRIEVKMK